MSFTYDALSRNLTQDGPQGTSASEYDLAGRRTKLTYPDAGLFVDSDYLVTGETTRLRENGAVSGIGVLATFGYDDLGNRTTLTRGNGTATTYDYDPVSRLESLAENFTGTPNDQTATFTLNPASQIESVEKANVTYAWTGHGQGTTATVTDGLNRLATVGGTAAVYDTRGNLTTDPTSARTYGYTSENLLTSASGGVTLGYDPLLRLHQVAGAATTRFAYDGLDAIAEYDGANTLQRRFVHGPGMDEPLVQYEGSGTTDRRWLHADERGSVIAISDAGGNVTTINRYDEYGKPQATNVGRFGYTGQKWIGEVGLNDYKFRMYAAHLGRFTQIDPIGVEGGINLYAYVSNDPINFVDPLGLAGCDFSGSLPGDILVCGTKWIPVTSGSVAGTGNTGGDPPLPPRLREPKEPRPQPPTKKPKPPKEPKKDEKKKEKEQCPVSEDESIATGATAGSLAYGGEFFRMGISAARGASTASLFFEGVTAAALGTPVAAFVIVGVGVYAYDKYSGGKVTRLWYRVTGYEGC